MNLPQVIFIILLATITGCASSSSLQKSADNHTKASEYYKSNSLQPLKKELWLKRKMMIHSEFYLFF
jgi:hypothetical protein